MLTITCPFLEKLYCLNKVLESMRRLQLPIWPVKWVFFNNSGNKSVSIKLKAFLKELVERDGADRVKIELVENPRGKYDYLSVYKLYNDLHQHVEGYWLSLEDDVSDYPPDIVSRMLREIQGRHNLGVVSSHMATRRGDGLIQDYGILGMAKIPEAGYPGSMCWDVDIFKGEIGLRAHPSCGDGFSIVDAVHTGCTLISPRAHEGYTFRQTGPNDYVIGHDIHLCLDSKEERGLLTGVIWGIRPGHLSRMGPLYPIHLPHHQAIFGWEFGEKKDPLISIILPTKDRKIALSHRVQELFDQTYGNFELLICNDGLPDLFEISDSRIRSYGINCPFGFSGGIHRNMMLSRSGGDLVIFLEDDVQLEPFYLETFLDCWRRGYSLGIAQLELNGVAIPENKDMVAHNGHMDSACACIDRSLIRGFSWPIFEDTAHSYFRRILKSIGGACFLKEVVVGRRQKEICDGDLDSIPGQVLQLATNKIAKNLSRSFLIHPLAALLYVMGSRDGARWESGEFVISQHPWASLFYVQNVLRGRFRAAEAVLAKRVVTAVTYSGLVGVSWKGIGRDDVERSILESSLAEDYKGFVGRTVNFATRPSPDFWGGFLKEVIHQGSE